MVTCPNCAHGNPEGQRYCGSCGARLEQVCGQCGEVNPLAQRFCGNCGSPLQESAPTTATEERRWATVVFADLSGFTELSERTDPEEVRVLADRCAEKLGEVVTRYGGWVNRVIGDATLAVFGAPVAHEDDAERAVRAALDMQKAAVENPADFGNLTLSIGINTGEMMVAPVGPEGARDPTVMGDAVNTAARLQSQAPSGGILVGLSTYEATRLAIRYDEVEPFQAKGKTLPVRAWAPVEPLAGPAERVVSRAPLVGRDRELGLLVQIWERAVAEQRPHLVTILGPPGIGKTRLTREFLAAAGNARIAHGRCLPYGEMTGYSAFAQQLKNLAGVFDSDSAATASDKIERMIGRVLGPEEGPDVAKQMKIILGLETETAADRQMLFFAARRLVEAVASEQETIFLFEDIHWADESLLDLIEMLASRTRDASALLLTLSRPELLTSRPSWGGGLGSYTALPLEPLSDADARALVLHLWEHAEGSAAQDLGERAGGNPLFIEELAASLAERAEAAVGRLPTSVQGIIAARLDSLPAHARSALLDASVVGKLFWRGALERIGGNDRLDEALDLLEERDFIRRTSTSAIKGETEFIFKHMLIREVAYETLPRAGRRERHAAVAAYLEEAAADRVAENASLLAHHWKEAHELEKAVDYLLLAAEKAKRSWAMREAVDLLDQALELIPAEEAERRRTLSLLKARTLSEGSDFAGAVALLDQLMSELAGEELAEAIFLKGRSRFWLLDVEAVKQASHELGAMAEQPGCDDFRAPALHLTQLAAGMDGRMDEAIASAEEALAHWPKGRFASDLVVAQGLFGVDLAWVGRFADSERVSRAAYSSAVEMQNVETALNAGGQLMMALTGLGRHEEAIAVGEEVMANWRDLEATPRLTARATSMLAGTLRELFLFEEARVLNVEAMDLGRRAPFQNAISQAIVDLVFIDLAEGEPGRAASALPQADEEATKLRGWHEWLVGTRLAEARAQIALDTSTPDEAASLATAAVDYAKQYGRVKYEIRSRLILAAALGRLDRGQDAVAELRRAVVDAERMAHPPTLWRAHADLGSLLYKTGDDAGAESAARRAREVIESFREQLTEEHRMVFDQAAEITAIRS